MLLINKMAASLDVAMVRQFSVIPFIRVPGIFDTLPFVFYSLARSLPGGVY